jgi:hypothetical protein
MIKKLDTVVVRHDVKEHGLETGDVGAVVHCFRESGAYEVEFVTAEGTTVALLTLTEADVRPMNENELLHVRQYESLPA